MDTGGPALVPCAHPLRAINPVDSAAPAPAPSFRKSRRPTLVPFIAVPPRKTPYDDLTVGYERSDPTPLNNVLIDRRVYHANPRSSSSSRAIVLRTRGKNARALGSTRRSSKFAGSQASGRAHCGADWTWQRWTTP